MQVHGARIYLTFTETNLVVKIPVKISCFEAKYKGIALWSGRARQNAELKQQSNRK